MNEFLKDNRYILLLFGLIALFTATAVHGYHDGEPELAKESFDLVKQFAAATLTIIVPKIASAVTSSNGSPK